MSRPKPSVLLSRTDGEKEEQITASPGIYIVTYRGDPIGLRHLDGINLNSAWKYHSTSWPNPGHAFNTALRLNQRFNTDEFRVSVVTHWRDVSK